MIADVGVRYPVGTSPIISYVPYLIVCSYLVSFIGAFTTVELLHRRVSGQGWRSWVQVAGCAVSFGLVAIWCMHFVGNRAIVLGDGESEIQLYYNPTYTALSAILPVVVIFIGLMFADRFYTGSTSAIVRSASLLVCALCGGAAVTGMHYLGNSGTTNYRLHLSHAHVIAAACTAFGACLLSFGLFFHWSQHWVDNILRRLMVACLLASAVSAMHWIAAAGTRYEIRGYHLAVGSTRNTNLIISICLCMTSCGVCFLLGFLKQRQRMKLRDRAQQIVLAVATFDPDGKLLVSQSGLMPCQTITQRFHERTFYDEFDIQHPVFQWIFRVSRNWAGISDLIPTMREHLQMTGYLQRKSSAHARISQGSNEDEDDDVSYAAIFRELFCVTAQEIAKTLGTGLQNLGCLHDEVLATGTAMPRTIWQSSLDNKAIIAADVATQPKDIEAGITSPVLFGKGQMLVLTRKIDASETTRLRNLGYSFVGVEQINDSLARSLQVSSDDLRDLMSRLRLSCARESCVPRDGTFIAAFLIQPSPAMDGLEVVVPQVTPNRLPMVKLSSTELDSRQSSILAVFDGLTLDECLQKINHRPKTTSVDDQFLERFRNRIFDLVQDCPDHALRQAIFSAQQIDIGHGMVGQRDPSQATVFAFCGIKEIYNRSLPSLTLKTIPLSFLQTYLRSYVGCPDHAILAQKNHKEFSGMQQAPSLSKPAATRRTSKWPRRLRGKQQLLSDTAWRADSCSEQGLVGAAQSPPEMSSHPWGGIMVTSTQNVIVGETIEHANVELHELGVRAEIGIAETEQQTMADKLMAITTAFRDSHSNRGLAKDTYHNGRKS